MVHRPALHIVGGGEGREDALRQAREAILFTLETDQMVEQRDPEAEAVDFEVEVTIPA